MAGLGTILGGLSGFKGRLLLFAGIIAVAGLGMNSLELFDPASPPEKEEASPPSMKTNWAGTSRSLADYSHSVTWGDAAIQLALSFGIAMIFASLLRAFLKSMVSLLFIAALVCWFLHSRGLIDPFWEEHRLSMDGAQQWIFGQTETVKEFVGGVLPSTGAAVAGFFFGLRK